MAGKQFHMGWFMNFTTKEVRVSKQYITEICEGLIPALQRRGLTRTEYTASHLRDTLREF